MTIYAISPLKQGYSSLPGILETIEFDKEQDTLWLTGNLFTNLPANEVYDLFNTIKTLGKRAISVLGERDLKLLGYAEGFIPTNLDNKEKETFDEIIASPGHVELLKWLRQRPFMHHDKSTNFILVHAGIPAEWSLSQASTFSIEAETALSFGNHRAYFENTQKNPPRRWNAKLQGWKRLHFITHAFTRIRNCNEKGYMDFSEKVPASADTHDYQPWYQQPVRLTKAINIVFDHNNWPLENSAENIYALTTNKVLKITDTIEILTV